MYNLNEAKRIDKNNAIKWAKEVLENRNYLILDTETTGLDSDAEIVQIGIIDIDGNILLDSLIKPSISIPRESSEIHGIFDKDVADAPTFSEVYPKIEECLRDKEVIIYNAGFDIAILNYCCKIYQLPKFKLEKRIHCAMRQYSRYYGLWSNYHGNYRWLPLNGGHNAISDCLACLKLINEMATNPTP